MFFKNALWFVFLKFFWVGLILGLVWILCAAVIRLSRKNLYVYNLLTFCFWLAFGLIYARLCIVLYDYSFCWFGLVAELLGVILVRFSIQFFFTMLIKLLYNGINKRKNSYGRKLRSSQKT